MRMMEQGDVDLPTRDRLVMEHVGLVRMLASRLARRLPPEVEVSELISIGVLGLMDAAGRFRPALGVPFDAFARRRIHGAMLDALRQLDSAPRSVRRQQRALDEVMGRLRHEFGREPEAAELAKALHLTEADYDKQLDQMRAAELATVRSLDAESPNGSLLDVAVDGADGPHAQLERRELHALLVKALGKLPDRERQVLALYFEEELTLAEIGEAIGVGESRVSQIRTQAIGRLRSMLREWLGQPLH